LGRARSFNPVRGMRDGAGFRTNIDQSVLTHQPLPPAHAPARLAIPTSTATLRSLPPTWTPGTPGAGGLVSGGDLVASSTPLPSSTGFVLATFTSTSTATSTSTNTPTITRTFTVTNTRTNTPIPTATRTVINVAATQTKEQQIHETEQAEIATIIAQTLTAQWLADQQGTEAAIQATNACATALAEGGTCAP